MLSLRSIVLATTAAAAIVPATASAATYCVYKPDCSGLQEWTLQDAITDAGKDTGPVRIELGPGMFTGSVVVPQHAAGLEIVGEGPEATILEATLAGSYALELHGGTVSQMGFSFSDLGGSGPKGLHLVDGASADHIRAVLTGTYAAEPLRIERGGNLSHAYIDTGQNTAVHVGGPQGPGDVTIADSYLRGRGAIVTTNPGHTVVARRDRLVVVDGSLMTSGGTTRLEDSLVDARGHSGPILFATTQSTPDAAIDGRHLTMLADDPGASGAVASSSPGNGSATVTLSDSMLLGAGVRAISAGTGAPLVAMRRVDTWPAAPDKLVGGEVTDEGSFSADPLLGADYVPGAGSPLIDAAAALGDGESDTDLAGTARTLDGDGNCDATPDIGAFESPAQACAAPPPPPPPPGGNEQPPAHDAVAPVLSGLRLSRYRVARFTLSEQATVRLTLRRCTDARCTHTQRPVPARVVTASAGARHVRLRRVRPGRYLLRATVVDAAGNRGLTRKTKAKVS